MSDKLICDFCKNPNDQMDRDDTGYFCLKCMLGGHPTCGFEHNRSRHPDS